MENPEEILQSLDAFAKMKPKDIPKELEDYLAYVAKTGDPVYQWSVVKYLFREKLLNVISDFYETTPTLDLPPCPNVDPFNYDIMKSSLLERLDSFASAPFTVQRLCELLTTPRKEYSRVDKFMRAIEKNILVVSTREPGNARRSESQSDFIMNGVIDGRGLDLGEAIETVSTDGINMMHPDDTEVNVTDNLKPDSCGSEEIDMEDQVESDATDDSNWEKDNETGDATDSVSCNKSNDETAENESNEISETDSKNNDSIDVSDIEKETTVFEKVDLKLPEVTQDKESEPDVGVIDSKSSDISSEVVSEQNSNSEISDSSKAVEEIVEDSKLPLSVSEQSTIEIPNPVDPKINVSEGDNQPQSEINENVTDSESDIESSVVITEITSQQELSELSEENSDTSDQCDSNPPVIVTEDMSPIDTIEETTSGSSSADIKEDDIGIEIIEESTAENEQEVLPQIKSDIKESNSVLVEEAVDAVPVQNVVIVEADGEEMEVDDSNQGCEESAVNSDEPMDQSEQTATDGGS